MSELELFQFEGYEVRTVDIDGKPWFVAGDVCKILGITNTRQAVGRLDGADVCLADVSSGGQRRATNVVSEPGLMELAFRSDKPQARALTRYVTNVVIPEWLAAKTAPALPVKPPTRLELAQMVVDAEIEIASLTATVNELEPQAAFAEGVMSADGDWSVRDAAQMLSRDPAISTGQNRLFGTLRMLGWIDRRGTPIQKFIDRSMLATRVQTYEHPHTNEPTLAKPQVRITGKGLVELHSHLGGQRPLRLDIPITLAPLEHAR